MYIYWMPKLEHMRHRPLGARTRTALVLNKVQSYMYLSIYLFVFLRIYKHTV